MTISGKTQVFAVIGDPITHSLSPIMHNAAFEHMNLNLVFLAFKVVPDQLEHAIKGVRALGIRGLNVTMPHKNSVTMFLDDADASVKFLRAANTILNQDGRLRGFNTDGIGAVRALKNNGVDAQGKTVLLLGGGGAAKAIAFALVKEVDKLIILNRDVTKARDLASLLQPWGKEIVADELASNQIRERMLEADLLVNATSVGMAPGIHESLVNPHWLRPGLCVMDIVYNPVETKLIRDAKVTGAQTINGLEMLLYQGAASFEIWMGSKAPIDVMRAALLEKLTGTGGSV